MIETAAVHVFIISVFAIGYLAIIFEHTIKVNKTASALLMAVLTWMFLFIAKGHELADDMIHLSESLSDVSQIIFFLLGAMTLVELVDCHKGFKVVTDLIQTSSKKKMLWIMGFVAFFLSAVLDNLTTTIVMISLLRKLVPERQERLILGSMVVIAANAGGAWTPIGDVTTTMLWINGNISSLAVMEKLFLPSFLSLILALVLLGSGLKGRYPKLMEKVRAEEEQVEPYSRLVFFLGLGSLVFVPIFKALTGLPPFMGILIALGFLWLVTDLIHQPSEKEHLRVPHILTRVDTSGILFFFGILLCIGSLDALGLLRELAQFLDRYVGNLPLIATIIGLISAVIDNVPLVAATMGMYDIQSYPVDSSLWQMIAYCAGTGGSILIIGSAAGVAFMGMEKVDFMWYLRRVSLTALASYLFGMAIFMIQEFLLGSL
ncbi:MAG: sodium:proton antiporter NhaD [Verrucomicrobia bacterium]|nr:sodium:proton antiporter NhaD [Verrucomicrobiota bacterium]